MQDWPNPFIEQRADPFILRDGNHYYFIASVPEYDRLEIRRADSLVGLRSATPVVVWRKPQSGPMSELIWAPELHHIAGRWYIYFAATHTQALDKLGMFQHRMFALECCDADPLSGTWIEKGQVKTPFDTFASMPPLFTIRVNSGICGRKSTGYRRELQYLPGRNGKSVDDQRRAGDVEQTGV